MYASSNQSVATELFNADAVKSDTVNFTKRARRLFVGFAGNVALIDGKGNLVQFNNLPAGYTIDAEILRVNATNTTATGLIGFV